MNSEWQILITSLSTLANQPKITYRFPVVVDVPKNDVAGPVMRFCFPETESQDGTASKKQKQKKKKQKKIKRYSLRFCILLRRY